MSFDGHCVSMQWCSHDSGGADFDHSPSKRGNGADSFRDDLLHVTNCGIKAVAAGVCVLASITKHWATGCGYDSDPPQIGWYIVAE